MEIIIITVMVPLVIIITILFPTDPTNMSARILPLIAGTRPNVMDFEWHCYSNCRWDIAISVVYPLNPKVEVII